MAKPGARVPRTIGESAMRWSIVSGGGWVVVFLVAASLNAAIRLSVPPTFAHLLIAGVLLASIAFLAFAPFGLAYASLLTIRSLRQRNKDLWQQSDARDALRLNILAWVFGGVPSLFMLLILLIVLLVPNS